MTLHIAFLCDSFVLQVGDRLLSQRQPTGRLTEWDAYANKTIVVEADNGRLIVSYAGLAHIDNSPTDEWLVRAITGVDPEEPMSPGGGPPFHFGSPMHLNLGAIASSIEAAITRDFTRQTKAQKAARLEVLITGLTWPRDVWRRPAARPSTYAMSFTHSGNPRSEVKRSDYASRPYRATWSNCKFISIGAKVPQRVRDSMQDALRRGDKTRGFVESVMVDAIRSMAKPGSGIGSELMSVSLPLTFAMDPQIRFIRDTALAPTVSAFAPAIVTTAGIIAYPSVIGGPGAVSYSYGAAGRTISIESVPPLTTSSTLGTWASQPRPVSAR